MQLNRHWHRIAILAEELPAHLLVQTAQSLAGSDVEVICNEFIHNLC